MSGPSDRTIPGHPDGWPYDVVVPEASKGEGHCGHCGPGHLECEDGGEDVGWVHGFTDRLGNFRVWWVSGHCPACAEAERIAEAIYKKVAAGEDSLPVGSGRFRAGYISGLDAAAGIATAGGVA